MVSNRFITVQTSLCRLLSARTVPDPLRWAHSIFDLDLGSDRRSQQQQHLLRTAFHKETTFKSFKLLRESTDGGHAQSLQGGPLNRQETSL